MSVCFMVVYTFGSHPCDGIHYKVIYPSKVENLRYRKLKIYVLLCCNLEDPFKVQTCRYIANKSKIKSNKIDPTFHSL